MRPIELSDVKQSLEVINSALGSPSRNVQGFSSLHPIMRFRQWVDRRLGLRTRTRIPATVDTGTQTFQATIFDISPGGLGMSGVEGLSHGALITIGVGSLKTLKGEVRWCRADRCGVRLIPNH